MITDTAITLLCDWVKEDGEVCGHTETYQNTDVARKAGWGAYCNAQIRWAKWDDKGGTDNWFCPLHAKQFGANHGWGTLESHKPPATVRKKRKWRKK